MPDVSFFALTSLAYFEKPNFKVSLVGSVARETILGFVQLKVSTYSVKVSKYLRNVSKQLIEYSKDEIIRRSLFRESAMHTGNFLQRVKDAKEITHFRCVLVLTKL